MSGVHHSRERITVSGVVARALALALAATLAGCGGSNADKPATQVAAKVNGEEITVHQVNFVLRGAAPASQERAPSVKKQILERLIEQELLVQAADEDRLERTPAVLQRVEASRREILARAYLQKVADGAQRPDARDVSKFYTDQPRLFSDRKLYTFDEIVLPAVPPDWAEIEKMLLPAKTAKEAAQVLRDRGIDAPIVIGSVRGSEQLPLIILPRFDQVKEGDLVIYAQPPAVVIAQVRSVRSEPIDEKRAGPLIEQFLLSKRRGEAVQAEVKRLREAASIAYTGEFAVPEATSASPDSQARPPAPDPVPTLASPASSPSGDQATAAPSTAPVVDPSISRGLKGL